VTKRKAPTEEERDEAVIKATEAGYKVIPPQVDLAIKLALRGYPQPAIAKQLGVAAPTVELWMRKYRAYVDAQVEQLLTVEELIAPLVPDAIRTYRETLADPKTKVGVRLAAARDVLDRSMGKPVQRVVSDERARIEVVFRTIGAGADGAIQNADDPDTGDDAGGDQPAGDLLHE
jgi:predicted transcriptional regulator